MRWTVEGFSQKVLLELGLDATDAVLLRFVADFYLSGRMAKITIDEKEYFWLHYANVLAELPIIKIDKRQLANRLDYMVENGVMEKQIVRCGTGSKAYFRFNEDVFAAMICSDEFLAKEKAIKPEAAVIEKVERSELKDLFFRYYGMKAIEIRGTAAKPGWAAKEASLLKQDTGQFGMTEMIRYMRLFFSDSAPEVTEFTRTKMKAGYSYAVFHGMLGKLGMCSVNIKSEPCPECGRWGTHLLDCPRRVEQKINAAIAEQEVADIKEGVAAANISMLFNAAIGRKVLTEQLEPVTLLESEEPNGS